MFRDATDNLLYAIPLEGGVIDLQPLFFRLTLDVTTEFLFGESIESLKVPESTGEETLRKRLTLRKNISRSDSASSIYIGLSIERGSEMRVRKYTISRTRLLTAK